MKNWIHTVFASAVLAAAVLLNACAAVGMLPRSVDEVDFSKSEGKTGWSQYRQVEKFDGYNAEQIYDAAKAALGEADFALRRADKSRGYVIGEHGITWHDWNVIVGIYFKESDGGMLVAVLVEGSKDIGISGDVTGGGWTGEILNNMRDYLRANK